MKRDNFDLKGYLIENKMTENSRGEVRHHLGETVLDTRLFNTGLLTEMRDYVGNLPDPDRDEEDFSRAVDDLEYEQDPELRDPEVNECGDNILLGGEDTSLDEAGYTDDEYEDDGWSDPDTIGDTDSGASLLDLVGKDAERGRRAATRDIDRAERAAEKDDAAVAAADMADAPADEPADEPAAPAANANKWVTGDLTMDSLFGADAPNVDILVGDEEMTNDEALKYLFQKNKNYRPNLLKREVRSAMQYFRDYEKPDRLYLIPAIDRGGYEQSRFNPGNRAVAVVYRPESLSGQNWADQLDN